MQKQTPRKPFVYRHNRSSPPFRAHRQWSITQDEGAFGFKPDLFCSPVNCFYRKHFIGLEGRPRTSPLLMYARHRRLFSVGLAAVEYG